MTKEIKVERIKESLILTEMFEEHCKLESELDEVLSLLKKDEYIITDEVSGYIYVINQLISNNVNNVVLWEKTIRDLKMNLISSKPIKWKEVTEELEELRVTVNEYTMNTTSVKTKILSSGNLYSFYMGALSILFIVSFINFIIVAVNSTHYFQFCVFLFSLILSFFTIAIAEEKDSIVFFSSRKGRLWAFVPLIVNSIASIYFNFNVSAVILSGLTLLLMLMSLIAIKDKKSKLVEALNKTEVIDSEVLAEILQYDVPKEVLESFCKFSLRIKNLPEASAISKDVNKIACQLKSSLKTIEIYQQRRTK